MSRIKIRYSLVNLSTNSVITGVIMAEGETFADVCDGMAGLITSKIPNILNKKLPAEDPVEWSVLGFQEWKEWHRRVRNAREAMGV